MSDRIEEELALLRSFFPRLEYHAPGHWVKIADWRTPSGIWNIDTVDVAFQFPAGFPGTKPYGFHVSPVLTLLSQAPVQNAAPSAEPPFSGVWQKFSWDAPDWRPSVDLRSGSNMLNFVLTFSDRLRQGA